MSRPGTIFVCCLRSSLLAPLASVAGSLRSMKSSERVPRHQGESQPTVDKLSDLLTSVAYRNTTCIWTGTGRHRLQACAVGLNGVVQVSQRLGRPSINQFHFPALGLGMFQEFLGITPHLPIL